MRISKRKKKGKISIKINTEYLIIDRIDAHILVIVLLILLYKYL